MKNQSQTNLMHSLCLMVVSTTLTACGALHAQPMDKPGAGHKPPPEAFQACKTLKSGDDCMVDGPKGQVNGHCWAPEGKPLACKPKDAPPHEAPPPKQ